jgi:spermidine synthase
MHTTQPNLPGHRLLARTATTDCPIGLHQRGPRYVITACSNVLMSNDDTGSERALGRLTATLVRGTPRPRVLVGGLGMGFTLRALLDRLPRDARVMVIELLPAVARWNEERLGHLSQHPTHDRRVVLRIGDVAQMARGRPMWDAIVLDVDNGPEWMVQKRNGALYGGAGLHRLMRSLRPRGALVLWAADRHQGFERRVARMRLGMRRVQDRTRAGQAVGPALYVIRELVGGKPGAAGSW